MGDFNALLNSNVKQGSFSYIDSKMLLFHNFINNLNLIDLNFLGPSMTWNNCKGGFNNIQELLSRCLASYNWFMTYPDAQVLHLDDIGFYHRPILLSLHLDMLKAKRLFRFDRRWTLNPDFEELFSFVWSSDNTLHEPGMDSVLFNLKLCRHTIVQWNRAHHTNSKARIQALHDSLAALKQALI